MVGTTLNDLRSNTLPLHFPLGVKVTHLKAGTQQTHETAVDILFFNFSLLYRLYQRTERDTALHVSTRAQSVGNGRGLAVGEAVTARTPKIIHSPAVAHHHAVEFPLVAQNLLKQTCIAATGLAVQTLVGAHHLCHMAVLHQRFKSRKVRFPEIAQRQRIDVHAVSAPLRPAVNSKMLGAGQQLFILLVPRSLQSAHDCQAHARSQIRVFAVSFLAASPARVAENVDVRCPKRDALVDFRMSLVSGYVVLGPRLGAHHVETLMHQCVVPRGSQRHRNGKDGGLTVTAHTVQCLAPPVEFRNAKSRDGLRLVLQQTHLFLQHEASAQILGTHLCRK